MASDRFDNRLFVLVLQHPQEKKEALATAGLLCAALQHAELVVGLSWPNLNRALGRSADARRWAVLYLGSARPEKFRLERDIIVLDRGGEPAPDQQLILRGLNGVVLLDGSWSEAKTLWWRNPWLLKLHRIILNPPRSSDYDRIRREPRREALSTLEAAALVLRTLDPKGPEIEAGLRSILDQLLASAHITRRGRHAWVAR